MSIVFTRPRARRATAPGTVGGRPGARLADIRPGTSCRIVDIDHRVEPAAARRLMDLGFVPGVTVTVLRKAPLGDPVVLQVADYEVALRRTQTSGILVAS
ncbi:hypothetical protein Athai_09860 [Actinocatenispora thailandica]|uniref:Ferrous iron transporter FeoA-like domain-containing protein n=1 Tax=Actinocatenispora thailandica TaxID=227318 RepID=A0A7R7HV90_9ACTN|nr:FeoA family protein [Actinocatenispora thailandica]BCJ33483.1 hypothetical protein Athai_09860 [Actinocatenispora thailandica]